MTLLVALLLTVPRTPWLQWGGPNRDFQLPAAELATTWPESGPKVLWKRPLGDGYASIVTDGTTLYTLYKKGTDTIVIALDAATGKTVWEQTFDSAPTATEKKEIDPVHGTAPASTPVIVGDRLFAVTFMGRLVALDRASGRTIWSEELWRKHGGTLVSYGYTNSPMVYKDLLILPVGGEGHAMMAFRQSDGHVAWKGGTSDNAMASPVMINVDGQEQVAIVMLKEVLGVSPQDGKVLWRYPHANKTETNVTSPLWCGDNTLLISSAYDSGTRALKLTRDKNSTTVKELWYNQKARVHHTDMLSIGGMAYGSSGDFGPAPMTALNVATGVIAWQDRAFAKSNLLRVGDKAILLDEQGKLGLVSLAADGMKVLASAETALQNPAWTPPTLSGTTLFLRDRAMIISLDLGR